MSAVAKLSPKIGAKLMEIPVGELLIDKRYQRPLDDRRVAKYAQAGFDPIKFGALICARRKEGFAVIDGQHRAALVKVLDRFQTVPCLVYDVASSEMEAALFVSIQEDRKAVTPYQRHRAQLHRHDPVAVGIEAIATSNGMRIADSNKVHGTINAVQEMRAIYIMSPDLLSKTLETITRSWGLTEQDARTRTVLVGIARFLRHASPSTRRVGSTMKILSAQQVDMSALTHKLSKETPARIIREARSMAKELGGVEVGTCAARTVLRIYNSGRRTGRIDPSGALTKGGWS